MTGFSVRLQPPDLGPWRAGNTGLPGFTSYDSGVPGPHVLLLALMHGNELAGAIVLDRLLRQGVRPAAGRLSLGFANLAALDRFDPANPTLSRCIDEDLNRVWDPALLHGRRRSCELDRARAIWDFLPTTDVVLDLHSMLWPSAPLMLSGQSVRSLALCQRIGQPGLVVADAGHTSGRRLIDHPLFSDPATQHRAVLLEAGPHWQPETVAETEAFVTRALALLGTVPGTASSNALAVRTARVTHTVTAQSRHFTFTRSFIGGERIADRDTLIAWDGDQEIRTPYDDCMLIMPNPQPGVGHTALRLARLDQYPAYPGPAV